MHTSPQGSPRISTAATAAANCNDNRSVDHFNNVPILNARASFKNNNLPVAHQQHEVQINDEKWMEYAELQIEKARRLKFAKQQTIFPVPDTLLEVRSRSYIPRLVNIGLLYSKLEPSPVEDFKFLCVKEFMRRHTISLDDLMRHTVPDQEDLQYLYFNAPKYSGRTLKFLLTRDTVFIYEFLFLNLRNYDPDDESCGYMHSFFSDRTRNAEVVRDLFLVGNQVPMSFLKRLSELPLSKSTEFQNDDMKLCLDYLVWRCNPFFGIYKDSASKRQCFERMKDGVSVLDCEHLLDCLYKTCVKEPDENCSPEFDSSSCRLPTASALSKVGIKFSACVGETSVIKYRKESMKLELPRMQVFDATEDILRNMIAYEITSMEGGDLCRYAILMDSLIDTADDLAILEKAGVLENHLGSNEKMLQMWNELCIGISLPQTQSWKDMNAAIMRHYKSNWRAMSIEFHKMFCSRPWLWLSTIAAVVLLLLSALQTFYTVLSYYNSG
ncbi:hypothetical protein KP509_11G038500 [Ceratopteris richardii]|uniref:Uncharacterized protein n=1 Tax=Ceratopteris richardii TaxID=49495 RepID=A0A8T2TQN4_CERRI|nr:hypothetical protein KP509_11G038500 [Ceratopteris richardii]KAH7425073.1 hypothetical protein KP509_11G038500 [Ceratopteris richardii]KAH7425074.1 hypothetical protein KP509_11G038500 [Ceratopteris richardii]